MTERRIMSMVFKIMGIYCVILTISLLSFTVIFITPDSGSEGEWILYKIGCIITPVLLLISAVVFIAYSESLAERFYPSDEKVDIGEGSPQVGWYVLALVIVGLGLLTKTISVDVIRFVLSIPNMTRGLGWRLSDTAQLVTIILNLVISFYLVFGAKRLATFLYRRSKKQ